MSYGSNRRKIVPIIARNLCWLIRIMKSLLMLVLAVFEATEEDIKIVAYDTVGEPYEKFNVTGTSM